jgi:hypothetical protein
MEWSQVAIASSIVSPLIMWAVAYGGMKAGLNGTKEGIKDIRRDMRDINEKISTLPCASNTTRIAVLEKTVELKNKK